MRSRRVDILTVLLLALSAAAILSRLGRFPALTSDEAWIGLYALRQRALGLYTPHEMNTYTGPLFGFLVSRMFAWRGASVETLRILGASANVLAALLVVGNLRRRVGAEAASWTAALIAASAYFLLKSRLSWDVYALQPVLLAITICLLDGPVTFLRALLFCAVTLVGVQNHFIYLSVPASLVALYGARCAWREEDEARPWLRVALSALAAATVIYLVKPRLTDAFWTRDRIWALPLFFSLPLLSATAAVRGRWESVLINCIRHPAARRWLPRLFVASLTAFAVWHIRPLWALLAGPVVWRRVFSWNSPWWIAVFLRIWSAFLIARFAWRAIRAWHVHEPMSAHERTLTLWPTFYAAVFILFRNTSSLRYYSLIQFIGLAALGPALAHLPRPDRRIAAVCAAIALLMVQTILWREIRDPRDRPPLDFRIGWHRENSRDFLRKEALFAAYDASGACEIAHQERSFVSIPLDFHRETLVRHVCDPAKSFDANFSADSSGPPYYRWEVVGSARSAK